MGQTLVRLRANPNLLLFTAESPWRGRRPQGGPKADSAQTKEGGHPTQPGGDAVLRNAGICEGKSWRAVTCHLICQVEKGCGRGWAVVLSPPSPPATSSSHCSPPCPQPFLPGPSFPPPMLLQDYNPLLSVNVGAPLPVRKPCSVRFHKESAPSGSIFPPGKASSMEAAET